MSAQVDIDNIIKIYLEKLSAGGSGVNELEVRFGTRGIKRTTRINYDNIIQKLLSAGFVFEKTSEHSLKMRPEFTDIKGQTKESNVRAEIMGLSNIENYCKTNDLSTIHHSLIQKGSIEHKGAYVKPVNVDDFNFRITLSNEQEIRSGSGMGKNIVDSWNEAKKSFRLMNRVSLIHATLPFRIDLSIVKESRRRGYGYVLEYTMQDSGVLDASENYEIEIEVVNEKIMPDINAKLLANNLRKTIKYVLSGFQETNYPISYKEMRSIARDYLTLIYGKADSDKLYNNQFIGPSSYTLQLPNIVPVNPDMASPNIRNNYTVTEKADGMRKILFINETGTIVLMDTNMNIQGTGVKCHNKELFNTIIDGEHILHNKKGDFINLYAAFDIYFLNKKNIRSFGFAPLSTSDNDKSFRLPLLHAAIKKMKLKSYGGSDSNLPIRIEYKNFKIANEKQSIFQCCNMILTSEENGNFEYNTDGLIFTPADTGVGSAIIGKEGRLRNDTWERSFKWKPAEFNTIDFLITTKKSSDGKDFLGNIFQEGFDAASDSQISQYKTLSLRVGFNESDHGYINPCGDLINDKIKSLGNADDEEKYKPVAFYPSNPSDPNASVCHVLLETDADGNMQMISEEGEVFEDGMIVEFKYDMTKPENYKWVPLRVRYDKTASYRAGNKQYGNAYHVANSNWYSIHNPITNNMIRTGESIPDEIADDDVYYNRFSTEGKMTRAMRNFHNLYVKQKLIVGVSRPGNTLVDLAVGKAGDLSKWIKARLSFVLGIDVSPDNIENRVDGACARYLNDRKKFQIMPAALFVHGNSSVNIRDGSAMFTEKGKEIVRAVFGTGTKDKDRLGEGVYKQYGKASDGFQITSCQFAIHYFFKDLITLASFARNVSEMTKVDGYFIGTSYDGKKIFNALSKEKVGESKSIISDGVKIWQLTKQYDNSVFEDNETCLNYAIDVYQDSINKPFTEYLVNYDYFARVMNNYGFEPLTRDEAKRLGFQDGIGSFEQLYRSMQDELKRNKNAKNDYGLAPEMTRNEKQISFYNNYFIFKKVRNVDSNTVYNAMTQQNKYEIDTEEKEEMIARKSVQEAVSEIEDPLPKKLKRKVKLVIEED
jgi:hypothetical protein